MDNFFRVLARTCLTEREFPFVASQRVVLHAIPIPHSKRHALRWEPAHPSKGVN